MGCGAGLTNDDNNGSYITSNVDELQLGAVAYSRFAGCVGASGRSGQCSSISCRGCFSIGYCRRPNLGDSKS